jgi:hypothetical protein
MTDNRIKRAVIHDPSTDRHWDLFQEWLDDPLDRLSDEATTRSLPWKRSHRTSEPLEAGVFEQRSELSM